jgi:hypothetical protein
MPLVLLVSKFSKYFDKGLGSVMWSPPTSIKFGTAGLALLILKWLLNKMRLVLRARSSKVGISGPKNSLAIWFDSLEEKCEYLQKICYFKET